jgi:hypothetical protein
VDGGVHLILIALFLIAPELRRLAAVFVWNRHAMPSTQPAMFRTPRANRVAFAAQIAFGFFLATMLANLSLRFYDADGGPGARRLTLTKGASRN